MRAYLQQKQFMDLQNLRMINNQNSLKKRYGYHYL